MGQIEVQIRDESPTDIPAIHALNCAAFGSDLEAQLVDRLRADGLFIRSRVAVTDGRIVGHILFSGVSIEADGQAVAVPSLAPMAVLPESQRSGIGSALIEDGIACCRRDGWPAIIVVGHPEYYPRFGFSTRTVRHLDSPYAGEAFMGLELVPGALTERRGTVRYPKAFDAFA